MRLHINITTDCVLDLSTLNFPKTLGKLEKLMTDIYKKLLMNNIKVSAEINQRHKKFIYFPEQQ